MSDIPALPYALLYGERRVRTVTNNTRADGHAFLAEAARAGVHVHSEVFPFEHANDALIALKERGIKGAAILQVLPEESA
jgi:propanol-preferring alcohol dehydrogenase